LQGPLAAVPRRGLVRGRVGAGRGGVWGVNAGAGMVVWGVRAERVRRRGGGGTQHSAQPQRACGSQGTPPMRTIRRRGAAAQRTKRLAWAGTRRHASGPPSACAALGLFHRPAAACAPGGRGRARPLHGGAGADSTAAHTPPPRWPPPPPAALLSLCRRRRRHAAHAAPERLGGGRLAGPRALGRGGSEGGREGGRGARPPLSQRAASAAPRAAPHATRPPAPRGPEFRCEHAPFPRRQAPLSPPVPPP
jgi:hypothetical protein